MTLAKFKLIALRNAVYDALIEAATEVNFDHDNMKYQYLFSDGSSITLDVCAGKFTVSGKYKGNTSIL